MTNDASKRLDEFLASGPKRLTRGERTPTLKPIEVALNDAEYRARTGDWSGVGGKVLVGLYAYCHRAVYGVVPIELMQGEQFKRACRQAADCLHQHFGDDVVAVVRFVQWTWQREKKRHEWAGQNGRERNRLGWRLQFSATVVTDYRVALEQARKGVAR